MYPIETVIEFEPLFEYVTLGWGVSIVAFFIIFFLCWGLSMLIKVFKSVAQ